MFTTLLEQATKTLCFEKESTMTSMAFLPLSSRYPVIMSYDTCCQGLVGTSRGFEGVEIFFGSWFHWHSSQDSTCLYTLDWMPGQ